MNKRYSRSFRSIGLLLVFVTTALIAGCDWHVDAQTFTVVDAQEESWFSDGDEPYLAVIQFRVTPGVPNSTSVEYLGSLEELHGGADDGDSFGIPDGMGRAFFANVNPVSFSDILAGRLPELIGAVTVAMEGDTSPWFGVNGAMGDVRDGLDELLRVAVETLTWEEITTPGVAAAKIEAAAWDIAADLAPSVWDEMLNWLGSLGDPDDVIGVKVIFFAAVKEDLRPFVDEALGSGLPEEVVARSLTSDPLEVTYSGDGATYRINFQIGID